VPNPRTVTLPGSHVAERIEALTPGSVAEVTDGYVVLEPASMLEAMRAIRDDAQLDGKFLAQMCSVDMITRIDVVYHFSSLAQNHMFESRSRPTTSGPSWRRSRRCGLARGSRSARSTT